MEIDERKEPDISASGRPGTGNWRANSSDADGVANSRFLSRLEGRRVAVRSF